VAGDNRTTSIEVRLDNVEYLLLFSNSGPVTVRVRFRDSKKIIAERNMQPSEVSRLVAQGQDVFLSRMAFDEWPFEVIKYELDPHKNVLTIFAGEPLRPG
jgi:ectoine hydroxylase-related dioxygenase (phytanoyl-CoA dioxygenase family)